MGTKISSVRLFEKTKTHQVTALELDDIASADVGRLDAERLPVANDGHLK